MSKPPKLDRAARDYHEQRGRLDQATAQLQAHVRAEHAAGMSEVELARRAGVTRTTIRAWVGKGRTPTR